MRVYLRRILFWLLVVLFFGLTTFLPVFLAFAPGAFPKVFSSKYYDFPEVNVQAWVQQDGSLRVVERRTYDFQKGDFHFATASIVHRQDDDIVNFGVSDDQRTYREYAPDGDLGPTDPGILNIDDGFEELDATWYFDASHETKTFVISYTALCAVNVYPDGAHLYWQFVPAGIDKPTTHTHVTIHLPGNAEGGVRPESECSTDDQRRRLPPLPTTPLTADQVRAWGHGPLQGEVTITDPQTIQLDVRDLKPFQFVEGSVLFPIDAVPRAGFTASGNGPDPSAGKVTSAAEVLAQEEQLAAHANATRHRNDVVRWVWDSAAVLYPLVLVGAVVWARRRDRVPGVPRTLQEPPEKLHPVDLSVLWASWHHSGLVMQNAYRAQLLWLAQEGTIEVRADGRVSDPKDIEVVLKELPSHPLDEEFTQYLFEGSSTGPVALSSLDAKGARGDDLQTWWKAVQTKIAWQRTKRHKRWEARVMLWSMFAVMIMGVVAGIVLRRGGIAWLGLTGSVVLWAFARWFLPSRIDDPQTRERVAKWAAFRRFLKRFSSLPDAPALAVVIWEQYLVYATALGVAKRVGKQVKALVPEEKLPAAWAGAPPGITGFSWASSIATAAPVSVGMVGSSSSGVSWSGSSGSFSSSSGFDSGGFSGGGGGGGGGGSRGAG